MKLPQLAAVFLTLGVGIAGVMAVEASAERARAVAPSSLETLMVRAAGTSGRVMGVDEDVTGPWHVLGAADEASGGYAPFERSLAEFAVLDIAADGGAQATAGCNRIRASVSQSGSSWYAGPAVMTRMACPDPAVMAAEQAIAQALSGADTISLEGDRAALSDASGVTLLVIERR
jgi:heat shock protein HslJ